MQFRDAWNKFVLANIQSATGFSSIVAAEEKTGSFVGPEVATSFAFGVMRIPDDLE